MSGQIKALEARLGYLLFERSRTGVAATVRGRELAARISEPVDLLAETMADNVGTTDADDRTVFVAGPAEFLSEVLLPGLYGLLPERSRLSVRFGLADELIDALAAGAVDVLVSSVPPRRAGISSAPVYDEEFILVAHPRWVEPARQELDGVPVLAYDADLPIIRRYWRSVFGRPPARLRAVVVAPDLRILASLAAGGAGMTVLPEYLVREHLTTGSLVVLHIPEVPPLNTLYVATRRAGVVRDPVVESVRDSIAVLAGRYGV